MKIKTYIVGLVLFFLFGFSFPVMGIEEYDLGISNEDIWFSKTEFFAGEKVKIYAQVRNYGQKDVAAYVIFYQGQTTIGEPQPISVVAGGTDDAVWVDWLAVNGDYEIIVRIVGQSPADVVASNDAITIPVAIEEDNDDDGIGNSEDLDDDNDGLTDEVEAGFKTDPLNPDTDNDGVIDSEDDYPLDSNRSVKEEPKEETKSKFPNSLFKSKDEKPDEDIKEVRTEGQVPYFEFTSEKEIELKERQEQAVLNKKEEVKEDGEEVRPNKLIWLWLGLAIGFLVYFSPRLAKILKSNGRRKRRKPRRIIKK